jgi:hypothetical protein
MAIPSLETRTKTHHLPQSHQNTKKKVLILLPSVKLRDFPARLRRSGGVSSWHSFSTGFLDQFCGQENDGSNVTGSNYQHRIP